MSKYFSLNWKHKPELASAFSSQETKLDHELIPQLEGKILLPFEFELRKVKEDKDGLIINNDLAGLSETWLDYQPNSLAWPLMSERLKSVIEKYLTGNEGIDWIRAVVNVNAEQRTYYIPRFEKKLDVLDREHTKYVPGTDQILKPCFSLSKINKYAIFHDEITHDLWKITPFLNVNETLKKAIQKARLTGLDFEKTSVA
jgi:hypothetical protein